MAINQGRRLNYAIIYWVTTMNNLIITKGIPIVIKGNPIVIVGSLITIGTLIKVINCITVSRSCYYYFLTFKI